MLLSKIVFSTLLSTICCKDLIGIGKILAYDAKEKLLLGQAFLSPENKLVIGESNDNSIKADIVPVTFQMDHDGLLESFIALDHRGKYKRSLDLLEQTPKDNDTIANLLNINLFFKTKGTFTLTFKTDIENFWDQLSGIEISNNADTDTSNTFTITETVTSTRFDKPSDSSLIVGPKTILETKSETSSVSASDISSGIIPTVTSITTSTIISEIIPTVTSEITSTTTSEITPTTISEVIPTTTSETSSNTTSVQKTAINELLSTLPKAGPSRLSRSIRSRLTQTTQSSQWPQDSSSSISISQPEKYTTPSFSNGARCITGNLPQFIAFATHIYTPYGFIFLIIFLTNFLTY